MKINLAAYHRWEIIGSGGKTTFMIENAKRLARQKERRAGVIFTTSTHLAPPVASGTDLYPGKIIECSPLNSRHSLIEAEQNWRQVKEEDGLCGLMRLNKERSQWIGFSPEELDIISSWPQLDYLLVEADGSKRLPVKAHASHEPVLYCSADLGVAVIGLQGLGRRIIDGEVHRPELMCRLLQHPWGSQIGLTEFIRLACAYLSLLSGPDRLLVFSQAEQAPAGILTKLAAGVRRYIGAIPILSQAAGSQGKVVYQEL
ncbi:MAG: selenium cofactor biosynthesis protein YqeC [Candidatus Bruticola sp.]